jgi:hypothetical protein
VRRQDCDLLHLGILHRLTVPKQQQHPHQHEQGTSEQENLPGRTGLKVLQLTGARLAPGPSTASVSTMQTAATAHAASRDSNHSRSPRSPPTAAAGLACGVACEPALGLQELHLGCQPEQVDSTWLHLNDAVTSHDIIRLLGDHCQVGGIQYVALRACAHAPDFANTCLQQDLKHSWGWSKCSV